MAQKNKGKTIVIGHKNPDTDSICSAICYAKLKELITGEEFMPGRAGAGKLEKHSSFLIISIWRLRS